jgi:PAS domain S-box-containing protein
VVKLPPDGKLRERAEGVLEKGPPEPEVLASLDARRLVHELQVHQVELEMQNEHLRAIEHSLELQNAELRAADRELELSRAQYRDLFELAPVGYVSVDTGGVVRRANEAAAALLGVNLLTLLQKPLSHYAEARDLRVLRAHLRAAALSRHTCEVSLRRPDGSLACARIESRPAPGGGCWTVLTDISERKRAEETLFRVNQELELRVQARTAELASRNIALEEALSARAASEREAAELSARLRDAERLESLGLFAGGIAHDFNNLLVGVTANADLLLEEEPDLSEEVKEGLATIKHAARCAADLTRQLLVYAGRGQIVPQSVRLDGLIQDTFRLLAAQVPAGIELRAELAADGPLIYADPGQIQQVIGNLVTNAIESLGSGPGGVVVRTRVERLDQQALARFPHHSAVTPGGFAVLEVEDTGAGIGKAQLSRIFEPFYTTKFTGRGLGLASVLGIVHSHHAALRVRSAPDHGTCFEIAWPLATSARTSSRPPPAPLRKAVWQGSGQVLLVDDDPIVRRALARQLEHLGFGVTRAASGAQAIELFRSNTSGFQLAVVDRTMPDMSGDLLMQKLHALAPELRAVLVSGYSAGGPVATDPRLAFVAKPMTVSDLKDAIAVLLEAPSMPS